MSASFSSKEMVGHEVGDVLSKDNVNGNGFVPDGSMAFTQIDTIKSISMHISGIKIYTDHMVEERKKVNAMNSIRDQAMYYGENINISFDKIRYHVDKLELIVDDQLWPLAKYREMLFAR